MNEAKRENESQQCNRICWDLFSSSSSFSFIFFFPFSCYHCELFSHLFNVCTSIAMVTAIRKDSKIFEMIWKLCWSIMLSASLSPDYHDCISPKVINADMHCIQHVPFMILLHSPYLGHIPAYHANNGTQ